MGMDVYGKQPTAKTGEYFRNNVWYWHPLWDYCLKVAPTMVEPIFGDGHTNSGVGLDAAESLTLAEALQLRVKTGKTAEYAVTYKAEMDALADIPCKSCGGTGDRVAFLIRVGWDEAKARKMGCNSCDGKGTVRPWETMYPFEVDNVAEFATFLEGCGGFEIN